MRLGDSSFWISINKKQEVWSNLFGSSSIVEESDKDDVLRVYRAFCKRSASIDEKNAVLSSFLQAHAFKSTEASSIVDRQIVSEALTKIIDFFSEFSFEPNFRFVNSFCYACNRSEYDARCYVRNYFNLIDSPYANAIDDKMNSVEFSAICNDLKTVIPSHKVNRRFKLFYGSQGTGKTTQAMKLANACMVCHSAMLPSDLMEDFKFVNGQATFIPSALQMAMTSGTAIVLDEINLLPFESLRFLQSILDNKSEFEYKGKTIKIKDGFMIIGTMNLHVNGAVYSLPEPLVDRAEELKKFNLTPDALISAIL